MSDAPPQILATEPEASAAKATADTVPIVTSQANARSHLQLAFTGLAGDYFRIWIGSLLLTLVTVGLWSPWAKVRKRRYFYGHTWLADANFELSPSLLADLLEAI